MLEHRSDFGDARAGTQIEGAITAVALMDEFLPLHDTPAIQTLHLTRFRNHLPSRPCSTLVNTEHWTSQHHADRHGSDLAESLCLLVCHFVTAETPLNAPSAVPWLAFRARPSAPPRRRPISSSIVLAKGTVCARAGWTWALVSCVFE